MPSPEILEQEKQRIWESAPLRDDIDDSAAELLLKWGEEQVDTMAKRFPDNFEQNCRFLRQLIKSINRFVGQRQFLNTPELYDKYMSKLMLWLPKLGYDVTQEQIEAALPDDKANFDANISAIIHVITPPPMTADTATGTGFDI
jgi:hypothetical protein